MSDERHPTLEGHPAWEAYKAAPSLHERREPIAECWRLPDTAKVQVAGTVSNYRVKQMRTADGGHCLAYFELSDESGRIECKIPRVDGLGPAQFLHAFSDVTAVGRLRFPKLNDEESAVHGRGDPILIVDSLGAVCLFA